MNFIQIDTKSLFFVLINRMDTLSIAINTIPSAKNISRIIMSVVNMIKHCQPKLVSFYNIIQFVCCILVISVGLHSNECYAAEDQASQVCRTRDGAAEARERDLNKMFLEEPYWYMADPPPALHITRITAPLLPPNTPPLFSHSTRLFTIKLPVWASVFELRCPVIIIKI